MAVSQQQRQSQLFAAEDWQSIYTAFTQVNFNSYDFATIRSSMIDYIRLNYPENFNDWVESSEFVALIDLLAYLGTNLAFRMDLNTRENFIDTATRRDSVMTLARMLGYQPQRCLTSTGTLKMQQVTTNQDLYDSNGTNLNGRVILWNDQNNQDWYEQFILVINASFASTNQFGNPVQRGIVGNITTELYILNNTIIPTSTVAFSATVSGYNTDFELINPNFVASGSSGSGTTTSGYFYEQPPNPISNWNIYFFLFYFGIELGLLYQVGLTFIKPTHLFI